MHFWPPAINKAYAVADDLASHVAEVVGQELAAAAVDAREIEQIADQVLHTNRCRVHAREVKPNFLWDVVAPPPDPLAVHEDLA